jgi:predicted O-linked N-acetylglucosamine transferase (SPINDLY family)
VSSALSEAVALLQQGQAAAARECLQAEPADSAEHAFLLGACAHALGDITEALRQFTDALKKDPLHVQAACALGSLYGALGRLDLAETLFRQTLAKVEHRQLRFNLAVVLDSLNHTDDADAEYTALIEADADDYPARHNRAGLYARLMRLHEAARDYRELVKRHPGQTLPWQNLADLELCFGHYESALELIREVRQREPDNAKALLTEAIILAATGQFDASRAAFAALHGSDEALWQGALVRVNGRFGRATDIDPRLIYLARQHEHRESCDWSDVRQAWRIWDEADTLADGELMPLSFRQLSVPSTAAQQKALSQRIAAQCKTPDLRPYNHQPRFSGEKLRIGYCSPAFGQHATGILLRRFFQHHNPLTTEVFVLPLTAGDGSDIAAAIRQSGARWVDVSGLDDQAAAARIHALNLDVLVDLGGYTTDARPRLFSWRPAPVQVSWLVMPCTTGDPAIDYFISDANVRPGDGWCSEAEVLLPQSYFVFSHDEQPPTTPRRAALGLPDERFVFCCLNNNYKIDPDTFGIWMQLLTDCPQSVLWLLAGSPAAVLNLKREAEWRGVDPRRLLFAPRVSSQEHLARLGAADLFLDTRYYNGHTTVAEALWSGLPVLTCPGDTFASRVGGSLVRTCGLDELVMDSWEAYRDMAQQLYQDRLRLERLRQKLAMQRLRAAPFDMKEQASALEKAFLQMRDRFVNGLPPQSFAVS